MKRAALILIPVLLCSAISFVAHPEVKYKKGAIVQFTSISPAGVIIKSREEVVSEIKNGAVAIINCKVTQVVDGKTSEPTWTKYYYDANHWASDVSIGMRPSQQAMEGAAIAEFSDSLVYPYNMKIGDTLPTAHAYKKMSLKGDYWELDNFYYNRKVMEKDTVVTPLGNIVAFRIEHKMSSRMNRKSKLMGDKSEVDLHYGSVWFSLEYGIVQTEMTNKFGVTKATLESIK